MVLIRSASSEYSQHLLKQGKYLPDTLLSGALKPCLSTQHCNPNAQSIKLIAIILLN